LCDADLRQVILQKLGADSLRQAYSKKPGFVGMRAVAADLIARGLTDAAEVDRVLGAPREVS
jgi:type II secretory ATPase GspE/PulE/Tfp pilus assembly ATPase PilB-like protein